MGTAVQIHYWREHPPPARLFVCLFVCFHGCSRPLGVPISSHFKKRTYWLQHCCCCRRKPVFRISLISDGILWSLGHLVLYIMEHIAHLTAICSQCVAVDLYIDEIHLVVAFKMAAVALTPSSFILSSLSSSSWSRYLPMIFFSLF